MEIRLPPSRCVTADLDIIDAVDAALAGDAAEPLQSNDMHVIRSTIGSCKTPLVAAPAVDVQHPQSPRSDTAPTVLHA